MSALRRAISLLKCAGGIAIGLLVFSQTAHRFTPDQSEVVVHVMEGGVDVTIDDHVFRVEHAVDAPITCELSEGYHDLKMSLHGELLYEESFFLHRGEEQVLTAWNRLGGKARIARR